MNPLRYRGYYQDNDTGFYYLQSRYYDPELKRFINADSYASTGQGFIGYNTFAYCGGEPIREKDADGRMHVPVSLADCGAGKKGNEVPRVMIIYDNNLNYGVEKQNTMWAAAPAMGMTCLDNGMSVTMVPILTTEEFIVAWNSMANSREPNYDIVIIYMHGGPEVLGYSNPLGGKRHPYYDELENITISTEIVLCSCNGATVPDNGKSVAQILANKANCPVLAVANGEIYSVPFSGYCIPLGDGQWVITMPE